MRVEVDAEDLAHRLSNLTLVVTAAEQENGRGGLSYRAHSHGEERSATLVDLGGVIRKTAPPAPNAQPTPRPESTPTAAVVPARPRALILARPQGMPELEGAGPEDFVFAPRQ